MAFHSSRATATSVEFDGQRRRSSGFVYPTVDSNGNISRNTFLDEQRGHSSKDDPVGDTAKRRPSLYRDAKASADAAARRVSELMEAKRLIDFRDAELHKLKQDLENARTESTRRASQARLFRESESQLRTELAKTRIELEEARDEAEALQTKLDLIKHEYDNTKAALSVAQKRIELMESEHATSKEASRRNSGVPLTRDDSKSVDAPLFAHSSSNSGGKVGELLVKVALPKGVGAEFLISLDRDDFIDIVEQFARTHRLSDEAYRVLVSFTLNEVKKARNLV